MQCKDAKKYIERFEIKHIDDIADVKVRDHVESCENCQAEVRKSANYFLLIDKIQDHPSILPNYSEFSDHVISSIIEQDKPGTVISLKSKIILKRVLQAAAALIILFATGNFLQQEIYMKNAQSDLQAKYYTTNSTNEYYTNYTSCKESSQELIKDILLTDKDLALAINEAGNSFSTAIINKYAKNYCISVDLALDYRAGRIDKKNLHDFLKKVTSKIN